MTVAGANVLVALILGIFVSLGYTLSELKTGYFHHSPGCNGSAFISALLPTNETAPLVFWRILAVRSIVLSVAIYVFQPFGRGEIEARWIVWRFIAQCSAILSVLGVLYYGAQPTRMCVSQAGFSYRLDGVNRYYGWNDVSAVKLQCESHGIKNIKLKVSDGSEFLLPTWFLFSAGQDKLVSIIDRLNIEFIGLSRPLTFNPTCRYRNG